MKRLLLLCLLLPCARLQAQTWRGSVSNLVRYIEVRPMARDTVDSASTALVDGRLQFENRPVFCTAGICTLYRPAEIAHAVTTTHDLAVTAWGLGMEGLSATAMLRVRTNAGGDFTWPRSDDAFDAILAYADLARERYRIRLGRQRAVSGLGFYSFDGIDARYDVAPVVSVEGYVGRSLERALEEPRNRALASVEAFVPGQQVWLVGGAAELNAARNSAAVRYQREVLGDRSGLVSERASLDFTSSQLQPAQFEGALDYDFAFGHVGKAHVTGRLPFHDGRATIEVSARRYVPFFELWTIWGAFSPVPYHEAEVQAAWTTRSWLALSGRVAFRKYQDTEAPVFIEPGEDATRVFALRARAHASDALRLDGEVRLERGFGAYLGSGEVNASWQAGPRLRVAGYATMFQQILEFRTGEAAIVGLGGSADYDMSASLAASLGGTLYLQRYQNRPSAADWNQKRAWLSLVWRFGRDPGLARPGGAP